MTLYIKDISRPGRREFFLCELKDKNGEKVDTGQYCNLYIDPKEPRELVMHNVQFKIGRFLFWWKYVYAFAEAHGYTSILVPTYIFIRNKKGREIAKEHFSEAEIKKVPVKTEVGTRDYDYYKAVVG